MHIVNSPSVPYWGHIPEGVHPGTVIQIDGHIPHHCSHFEVNLYGGNEVGHHAEKHSNIALQIRPKIHSKKVICNSRQFGNWGHKEKHRNFQHIHHGSTFNMQIIAEHQHYRVLINNQDICLFHHRIPFHEVRILNIEGHVDLHRIEYRHQFGAQPSAPVYQSGPAYVPQPVSYPPSRPVYQPSATVYPPPPVYVPPPVVQYPSYVPQTIVVEDHHHHGHHGHGIGHQITDAIFGHHHDHHHHGHHDSHHHHGHHWWS